MYESLAALFLDRVAKSGDGVAVMYKEGKGPYRTMTWREFAQLVDDMSFGVAALGMQPGARAAIMANTSNEWVAADFAILCNGGVSVPIYPTSSAADVHHILQNSESHVLFIQDARALAKSLKGKGEDLDGLNKIVLLHELKQDQTLAQVAAEVGVSEDKLVTIDRLRQLGADLRKTQPDLIHQRVAAIKPQDLATIIYTSGTTGTPKGVMLLNSTILAVLDAVPPLLPINEEDTYLAFLPLSHVFERVCGEFYWLIHGAVRAYAEGLEHLPKNMAETEPSVMLVVPRLLDKIYAKVMSGIKGASPRAQQLIEWAIEVGREVVRLKAQGRAIRLGLQAKQWLAERLVFRKLRNRIGRRLQLIVSGGAPGTPEVIEFFNAIGITVLEGYGLTETAAPTNVNHVDRNKIGTVGPALPCVEMRIAEDGEILFRGPSIFSGYFKAPDMTAEVFTDGWFHTGDIGVVDKDGYLKITDRKKDLIVNSSGKNIAPQKIEAILRTVPFVSQAVVFGDKRKTLVALLTLEEQPVMEFAHERGWPDDSYEQLIKSKELRRYIKNEILTRSHQLADYEQVRNFAILPHEFSVSGGEMTPTLKIKRPVLKQKYADQIESLYHEEGALAGAR